MQLTAEWFKGKRVTVMGLGVHGGGLGAAKWLLKSGAIVTVTDLRQEDVLARSMAELEKARANEAARRKTGLPPIRFVLGRHEDSDFSGADMVIRNPAVPRGNKFIALAEKSGVPVESDTSIFFSLCPFPIAAVSGTKGKTTTTTLLAEICRAYDKRTVVGGNIRISQLDSLDKLLTLAKRGAKAPPIVLELSSWQLESLEARRLSPHVGVLTNVMEDHLNRYDGMDDYARAKELIIAFQKPGDFAVVNADDARVAAMGRGESAVAGASHGGERLWFSVKALPRGKSGCFVRGDMVVVRASAVNGGKETILFPLTDIRIPGVHNVGNVLAACTAAFALGVTATTIRKVVRAFRGVPHRLETIAIKRGIRFVNDTTATAPDASIAALKTFGDMEGGARRSAKTRATAMKRVVLIAGGADKDLTFGVWAKAVKRNAKHLVLFDGTAGTKIDAALRVAQVDVPATKHKSMRTAFSEAVQYARRGDIVLLSPGCASFGVFLNEFDRGDQFTKLVKRLRGSVSRG